MVATRRGTRASSSAENISDEATGTPASTLRRTRRRTSMPTVRSQSEQNSDHQQDDAGEQDTASAEPASSAKRETRSSKSRPTSKQPKSTHEADVSESESSCSVVSDTQLTTRSRRRTAVRAKPTVVDEQEASKGESDSSSLGKTPRRSTRGQKKPVPALESTTSQEDEHSEAESCSSVASLSTRVTRSHRKPAVVVEDAAHSEADSVSSVVSGPQVSTLRRSTRSRVKVTEPIPINLEQSKTTEASGAFEPRRTRGQRAKAKSGEEEQAYDSEGCHSGPSLSPRRTSRRLVADSDSESISTAYTSHDSPCSTRERGTPCSSRTGSASSNCAVRVSRRVKVVLVPTQLLTQSVKKDSEDPEPEKDQAVTTELFSLSTTKSDMEDMEEDADKTVIAADQDCSVIEDKTGDLTLHEDAAEIVQSDMKHDISSQTENESQKIIDEAMETHEASSVEEIQAMGEESSSIPVTPKKSFTGTEEDQSSHPLRHEENLKVLHEPEETVEAYKETKDVVTDDDIITVDQGPSEECVMIDTSIKKGTSSSSEASKMSIEKTKPVKAHVSLLDSSEDEDSDDDDDDDGLSVNDEAEDMESEDEACCSKDQPGPSGAPDSIPGNKLFVIDTRPGCQPSEKYYTDTRQNEGDAADEHARADKDEEDFVDEEGDNDDEEDEDTKVLFTTRKPAMNELSSSIDPGLKVKALGGLYINFDGSKSRSISNSLKMLKDQKNQDELMKKSVIVADFEKKDTVPPYKESRRAGKLKRREERAKTTGDGWFNMRAPELTEDLKNDLKALKMRSAMDPKRFYKKNDREGFPKYFQVGTVVDNPVDFYHSRIPKKERKRTIMEELLADAEFRSFNKRKYKEIMTEKAAAAAGKMHKRKPKFQKKK